MAAIALAIALATGAAVGALFADGAVSDAETRGEGVLQAVSFETPGPEGRRTILDVGGLMIRAECQRYGDPAFDHLSVTASSAIDGASAVSAFTQREGAETYPYLFALRDFGPSYGAWDFLGTPYKVSGDLRYSRPDGGQVSLSYVADQQRVADGCSFGGTANYTPAQ